MTGRPGVFRNTFSGIRHHVCVEMRCVPSDKYLNENTFVMYNTETLKYDSKHYNTNLLLAFLEDAMEQAGLEQLYFCDVNMNDAKIDVDWLGKRELLVVNGFGYPNYNALEFLSYLNPMNHISKEEDFPFLQLDKEAQEKLAVAMYKAIVVYALRKGTPIKFYDEDNEMWVDVKGGIEAEEIASWMAFLSTNGGDAESVDESMPTNDVSITV